MYQKLCSFPYFQVFKPFDTALYLILCTYLLLNPKLSLNDKFLQNRGLVNLQLFIPSTFLTVLLKHF